MRYAKMIGVFAVTTAAVMALAGSASADRLTSPTGDVPYTGELKASSEGHAILHNPIAEIKCESTVAGKEEHHESGKKASGKLSELVFGNPTGICTNNWHVTVVAAGTLSVEHKNYGDGRFYDGDVYSDGATVEATRFGVTCRYRTTTTTVGRLTAGAPATMDIVADIPFHSGSGLCGSGPTKWTGNYLISTPGSLFVDKF